MNAQKEVVLVLREVLNLRERTEAFSENTPLLGSLPELDSIAIVSIITTLEERFDFVIEDDELDGATFQTVGTLSEFVAKKLL